MSPVILRPRWLLPALVALTLVAPTTPAHAVAPPITEASLEAALRQAARADDPKATLSASRSVAPLGFPMVTVAIEGAYPGTGLYSGVLAKARHFGPHGEDLAELARVSGWHEKAPDARALAELFCRLWRAAETVAPATTPVVTRQGDALVLTVTLVPALSPDDPQEWRVVLPRTGAWTQGPTEPPSGD